MSDQPTQHPYVKRLENISQSWSGDRRWADAPWSISNMYATTVRSALNEDDAELLRAGIEYFPRVCTMMSEGKIELQVDMVNNVLTLLNKKAGLTSLLLQPGGDQALAWFCCELAVYTAAGELDNPNEVLAVDEFIYLLETWSGRVFPSYTAPRVDNVVDFLYGAPCWSLYGCAVGLTQKHGDERDAVRNITRSGIPLLFSNDRDAVVPAMMPDTLM